VIIVSDTSPITNLAAIARLDLLQQLYEKVIIPAAVYRELTSAGEDIPGCREVQTLDWITVRSVSDSEFVASLQNQLDEGEAEAIALAIELKAEWLLIDEELGRRVAAEYQIQMTGVLGILIEAKHRGLISAVKPLLDALIESADFWVSQRLYNRVLEAVEEQEG
jgi:hypothetical protein